MMKSCPTMGHDVEVVFQDDRWANLELEVLIHKALVALCEILNAPSEGYEVAVLACDDAEIVRLNQDFRDKAKPTNVLSWPFRDNSPMTAGEVPKPISAPAPLGDIAISYDTCVKEAHEGDIDLADHTTHLMIHAVLHLLGYDHETDQDAELMEGIEVKTLANMGLHNPY